MNKFFLKQNKYKKGSMLIGMTIFISILMIILGLLANYYREQKIIDKGKLAGEQIRIVGQAADEYITINVDKIINLESNEILKCQPNGLCEITISGLRKSGELPNSFSDTNVWGSGYKIQIKREGTENNYKISGIIVTDEAPTTKPLKILGIALQTGGANAGNNLIDINKISGNAGLWSYNKSDFNIISDSEYQLAYRIGYNASKLAPYLRRDGSLNMKGHLELSGHNITNINKIEAHNAQINDTLNSKILKVDNIDSNIINTNAVNTDNVQANIISANRLNADNTHTNITNTNKINTQTAQVDHSLNVSGHTTTNSLHVNGDAFFGGNLTSDLIPKQTVNAGQGCSPNGLIGKNQSGMIMSCVNGIWTNIESGKGGNINGEAYLFFKDPKKFPKNNLRIDNYFCMITGFKHIGGVTNDYHTTLEITTNGYWTYYAAGGKSPILCIKR